jgi:hypothetical protein
MTGSDDVVLSAGARGGDDPKKARQRMAAMMGPKPAVQSIRMAVRHRWMMHPAGRRTPAELKD